MTRPRVLLVDDDAAIRRFAALALEDLDIELRCAEGVPEALALLGEHGPVQLVITDLMMPGASGTDLLRALAGAPALRGSAKLVVLSAGLEGAAGGELDSLDVWRRLHKPVSLAELVQCVQTAVAGPAAAAAQVQAPPPALEPPQAQALARYFGGDRTIFLAYHASCVKELANDIVRGHAAATSRDGPALRRLAHSLKSVLATLGYDGPAALARQLEAAASAEDWSAAIPLWTALHGALEAVRPLD